MHPWDELRIVLAVSRHGTLAAAAHALHINPTTVGRRLDAFEHRLGAKLFAKTRDGLRPTRAGDAAIEVAARIEDHVATFEKRTRDRDARLEGLVRVTAGDGVMLSVAPLVSAFRARYPGVQLDLLAENRVVDLTSGEADIAIRIVKPTTPTLVAQKVATMGVGLYARDDYLARGPRLETVHDLAAHTLIGMAPPLDNGPEARWLAHHGVTQYGVRCNTISLVLSVAASGAGVAVLPHNLAASEPRLCRVVRDAPLDARDVWLVVHREVRSQAPIRAVLGFLADDFKRNAAAFTGAGP
jgi:DNA-binding transcriptional LysR family regulator